MFLAMPLGHYAAERVGLALACFASQSAQNHNKSLYRHRGFQSGRFGEGLGMVLEMVWRLWDGLGMVWGWLGGGGGGFGADFEAGLGEW